VDRRDVPIAPSAARPTADFIAIVVVVLKDGRYRDIEQME
jgi:hypothetical protein